MEDHFFNMQPSSIIVTAKGMPDMATRFFLSRLRKAFPDMIFAAGLPSWHARIHECMVLQLH